MDNKPRERPRIGLKDQEEQDLGRLNVGDWKTKAKRRDELIVSWNRQGVTDNGDDYDNGGSFINF